MKTKLLCIVAALLFVSCFLPVKAEHTTIIIVTDTESESEVIHRDPSQIPIACFLEEDLYLLVNYSIDLGSVSIEIENLTTGEYSQTQVNALAGPMVFPISGTAGHWTITFTLSSGVVYYGEFTIF